MKENQRIYGSIIYNSGATDGIVINKSQNVTLTNTTWFDNSVPGFITGFRVWHFFVQITRCWPWLFIEKLKR